jgi:hypothetical protein
VDDVYYPLMDPSQRDISLTGPALELCQIGLEVVEFE